MFSTRIESGMLVALRECKVMLHLTGSRFFGGFTEESDYDFFCQDLLENFEVISSLGSWRREETQESMTSDSIMYNDTNTVEIWAFHGNPKIHIQFVKDVNLKLHVQEFLSSFPFHLVDKKVRRHVWNWAYKQVKSNKLAK